MSGQRHATMVAAASLALTLTPLAGIFAGLSWTIPVLLVVTVVATAGMLMRSAGRGQGLQTLAMAAALLVLMTALFNEGTAIALIIPTPATFEHWLALVGGGVNDIIVMAPPVEARGGILFLTMLGVGLVAILHDMFIVGLRTPALSGLTLLTMYLVPVSVAPEATAWFWFILPAAAYLWILADDNLRRVSRFGHRFTGSGRLVGTRFPSPLAATARVTGALFVAVTLLVLAVVPTNTSGLVDQVAEGYGEGDGPAQGGDVGEVDPWARLAGSLNQPEPQELLRVTTDDPSPRYLRMHVADRLTTEGFGPSDYEGLEPLDSLSGGGEVFTAEVENLRMSDAVVPVYGRPTAIDLGDEWEVDTETGVVVSESSDLTEVDSYTLQYVDPDWDPALLAAAGETPSDRAVFIRNTRHPNVPELTSQVEELLAESGAETVHEKTLAVLDFLSPANGFTYTLETAEAGNEEAILDFLETKEGFCQQYAGAMAWMLREAQVPARVVIGLTKGTYSEGAWTVSSGNFHAWVEVYYEGLGWVTFDPTPSSGVSNAVNFPWADEPAEEPDPVEQESRGPGEDAASVSPTEGPTTAGELDQEAQGLPEDQSAAPGAGGGFDPVWLALLPLLAVPFVPALGRVAVRRSRLGARRLSAHSAWDETRDLAGDYGIELHDSLTPRQAAAALAQAVPGAGGAVAALASAVEHHRYSPRAADTTGLPEAVRDLRARLGERASSSRRFRARFWPASLGTRFAERRGRTAERLTDLRSRAPWSRRSNSGGDDAVTGRP